MIESLTLLKVIVGLLGAICAAIICVVVWVIRVTEWKAGVDHFRKAMTDASPVSANDCSAHRTSLEERRIACQKFYNSELGHGQERFDKLDKKLEDKEVKDESRYQIMIEKVDSVLRTVRQ